MDYSLCYSESNLGIKAKIQSEIRLKLWIHVTGKKSSSTTYYSVKSQLLPFKRGECQYPSNRIIVKLCKGTYRLLNGKGK